MPFRIYASKKSFKYIGQFEFVYEVFTTFSTRKYFLNLMMNIIVVPFQQLFRKNLRTTITLVNTHN